MAGIDLGRIWTPLPTQSLYLDAITAAPDRGLVAYVGALGSGKSWSLCRAVIGLSLTNPGIRILVGRFLGTDLRDTTQAEFFEMMGRIEDEIRRQYTGVDISHVLGEYLAGKNEYQWVNGSLTMFRPLDEADKKYKSLTLGAFAVDEASEVPLPAMLMLRARTRQTGVKRVGFVTSNPTSTRHWLYEWFVRDPKTGEPHADTAIFRTKTTENHHLPANYDESLRASYPEDWIRLYLDGEWGELRTGQRPVFPTFSVKNHVGQTEWDRKKPVFVGIDWGYKNPGAVWFQTNDKGQLLVHRCWFPREIHTYQLGEGIRKRNGEWFPEAEFFYYAGWDGTKTHASAEKADVEILRDQGFRVKLVYGHIDRGLNILRNLMEVRDDGTYGLVINQVNERLIEGFMGGYHYDPIKGNIVSSEQMGSVKETPAEDGLYDQLMDALRYGVVSVFDTPSASPRTHVVYGYRKGKAIKRPYKSSIPSATRKVIGLYA